MTRCEFFTEGDRITGFSISGHSGYAEAGQDIVCAAISAVVTMAEATINDVCGAKAKVRVKDEQARITLRKNDFVCMEYCMTCEEATKESSRCLRCDHFGYGIFKGGRVDKW